MVLMLLIALVASHRLKDFVVMSVFWVPDDTPELSTKNLFWLLESPRVFRRLILVRSA